LALVSRSVVNLNLILELGVEADRQLTWQRRDRLVFGRLFGNIDMSLPFMTLASVF